MSNSYKITGGAKIKGIIKLSGSKNFSIKALATSLLAKGVSNFSNLPNNLDVHKTLKMLESLGVRFDFNRETKECVLDTSNITNVLPDSSNTNMTTFLIASALLKYFDYITFPRMKGCNIGDRLTDFHALAFNNFGVNFYEKGGMCFLEKKQKLKGCVIELPYPSVGATETCLFLASISSGDSIIKNIAIEPEINALITLLTEVGVAIFFESDRTVRVIGGCNLHSISNKFIHGDYLEAATWAVLAAINDGYIEVKGVVPELIGSFLSAFLALGGGWKRLSFDSIAFFKGNASKKSVFLESGVFPMLRTDLQPLLAVMAAVADGCTTLMHETVYNNRLDYISDFNAFGCHLVGFNECIGNKCRYFSCNYLHSVVIKGVSSVKAIPSVSAKTVRSGMANILLSTVAKGQTIIESVDVVERGYCSLFKKLRDVGVMVQKI